MDCEALARRCCCRTPWQRCVVVIGMYSLFFVVFFAWFGYRHASFPWMFYTTTVSVTDAAVELGACPPWVNSTAGAACWNGVVTLTGPRGDCDPFYPQISANLYSAPDSGSDLVEISLDLQYPLGREIPDATISVYNSGDCSFSVGKQYALTRLLSWALAFETCLIALTAISLVTCRYCALANDTEVTYLEDLHNLVTPDSYLRRRAVPADYGGELNSEIHEVI
jgi:hypothetical protein